MAKSSPEKLAAALRANLKRRKGLQDPQGQKKDKKPVKQPPLAGTAPGGMVQKPPKNSA